MGAAAVFAVAEETPPIRKSTKKPCIPLDSFSVSTNTGAMLAAGTKFWWFAIKLMGQRVSKPVRVLDMTPSLVVTEKVDQCTIWFCAPGYICSCGTKWDVCDNSCIIVDRCGLSSPMLKCFVDEPVTNHTCTLRIPMPHRTNLFLIPNWKTQAHMGSHNTNHSTWFWETIAFRWLSEIRFTDQKKEKKRKRKTQQLVS